MLLLILVLATVLRVRGIGHDSLWGDEALTIMLAKMPVVDLVKYLIWYEQIPPVHHLIVHYWMMIFGDSETSVRMPSALAGVGGVYMAYILVRRLMGERIALITALLLSVSPMHIEYSQECRAYALSVLIGLISCDIFIRLLRRPTHQLHIAYILVTTLFIYTHVYGLFTILAQLLVYAWHLWRRPHDLPLRPRQFIGDGVAILALYSPWLPIVYRWTRMIHAGFWVKKVTLDDISRSYWTFSGSTVVFVILVALLVVGIWNAARTRRRTGFVMLLAIMFVPVVVPITISVLTRPSYAPRYAIMSTVGMLAFAAIGIAALRPAPLRWAVLTAVVILSPMGDAADIPRAPWRDVGRFLNENLRSGDLVVIHLRAGTRLYDYYVDRPDVRRVGIDTVNLPVTYPIEPRRVWLIVYDSFPWFTANKAIARAPLKIGRRKFTWGVMALELVEDPMQMPATTQRAIAPAGDSH